MFIAAVDHKHIVAVYWADIKELWCDSCDFNKSYDSDLVKDGEYNRDQERWERDGCPKCGSKESIRLSKAYAN